MLLSVHLMLLINFIEEKKYMPSIEAWLTVIENQRTPNTDCSIIDSSRYLPLQPSIPRNIRPAANARIFR